MMIHLIFAKPALWQFNIVIFAFQDTRDTKDSGCEMRENGVYCSHSKERNDTMKILVLSDSHGNLANMLRAVEKEAPNMILHLGDCWRDGEKLRAMFPGVPFEQVPGNCDFRPMEETERLLFWEDKRVLMCHGHTYSVKQSLLPAGYAAEEQNLDLFLFGHTHRPLVDMRGKTLFLNPGSIGDYGRPFYGVVTLENGKLDARTAVLG